MKCEIAGYVQNILLTSNKFITKSKNAAAKKLCAGVVAIKIPRKLTYDG